MFSLTNRSTVQFNNKYCLTLLYSSLFRSHLEFASKIWSLYHVLHISKIKNVQLRFFKSIAFKMKLQICRDPFTSLALVYY